MANETDMRKRAETTYSQMSNYARICSEAGEGISIFDDDNFRQLCVNYLQTELESAALGGKIAGRKAVHDTVVRGLAQKVQ